MTESNHDRIDKFLLTLEKALGKPRKQAKGVVEEVSADLHAHVSRHISEGRSEDESVEKALGEMGNPYELAHQVSQQIPPFGGTAGTVFRYVAASGIIVWLLMLMWLFRAWSYSFSGFAVVVSTTFLHLPVILLLWPRIIWRKNWLFGLIPAGIAFVLVLFLSFGGQESSVEVVNIPQPGEEFVPVVPEEPSNATYYLVFAAAAAVALVMLFAIQQKFQRRIVLLALVLPIALIEAAFQLEEHVFRQDRDRSIEYFEVTFRETGSYPTDEAFKSDGPNLRAAYWIVRVSDNDFSLFWSRPLSSGFSLAFSPKKDEIWVQD